MEKSTLIAMSGGVDSSTAALLMKEKGFRCAGAYMLLHSGKTRDVEDARLVAERLGMEFFVLDFRADFEREVIDKWVRSYEKGETPNPCVLCNKNFKFARLIEEAQKRGYDSITTGHYARIAEENGRRVLKKAVFAEKDQSYVLYNLTPNQLEHVHFPLGEYQKPEIRAIAEANGFVTAGKKDSQDICFVPDGDYAGFIERRTGKVYPAGDFVTSDGKKLGTHKGMIHYTIGQRKGLGLALPAPGYVCEKNMEANTVVIGANADLFSKELVADEMNWVSIPRPEAPFAAKARTRYNSTEKPALVTVRGDAVEVRFDEPQRAITVGQSVVIYDGETVLGGGTIRATRIE